VLLWHAVSSHRKVSKHPKKWQSHVVDVVAAAGNGLRHEHIAASKQHKQQLMTVAFDHCDRKAS